MFSAFNQGKLGFFFSEQTVGARIEVDGTQILHLSIYVLKYDEKSVLNMSNPCQGSDDVWEFELPPEDNFTI